MRELYDYLKNKISELKKRRNFVVIDICRCISNIKDLKQDISGDVIRGLHGSLSKDDLVEERKLLKSYSRESKSMKEEIKILNRLLDLINVGKGKISNHGYFMNVDKIPNHGYFKTTYYRGKEPYWDVGNKLAYYESDIGQEYVLGTITKIRLGKNYDDWVYTFNDVYETELSEEELLKLEVYQKL